LHQGFGVQGNLLRLNVFLPKSWSFLAFQRHQRKVAMDFKLALGWLRESKESKTEAKELALWVKTLDRRNQGF
jgi:hypothetical protein